MKKIQSKAAKLGVAALSAVMAAFIVVASVGVPAAHAQTTSLSSSAAALAGLIAVNNLAVVSGAVPPGNLGSLIVLNGLFPTSTNSIQNTKNLAGLIAADAATGGAAVSGPNSLANLIVLNGLFVDP